MAITIITKRSSCKMKRHWCTLYEYEWTSAKNLHASNDAQDTICICAEKRKKELLSWRWEMAFFVMSCMSIEFFLFFIFYLFFFFQFPNIYSNTLVHSSPPPSAILYGKMSLITVFFSNEYIRHDTTFYALDIDLHFIFYFISYGIENKHLCETLWNERLGWTVKMIHFAKNWRGYIFEKVYSER
jgi:hypothetical protein